MTNLLEYKTIKSSARIDFNFARICLCYCPHIRRSYSFSSKTRIKKDIEDISLPDKCCKTSSRTYRFFSTQKQIIKVPSVAVFGHPGKMFHPFSILFHSLHSSQFPFCETILGNTEPTYRQKNVTWCTPEWIPFRKGTTWSKVCHNIRAVWKRWHRFYEVWLWTKMWLRHPLSHWSTLVYSLHFYNSNTAHQHYFITGTIVTNSPSPSYIKDGKNRPSVIRLWVREGTW